VLGIETSCDETSASVVLWEDSGPRIESLVILSQDVHRIFGGVVPELASRAHVEAIGPVVNQALRDAGVELDGLDGVAVTMGPGLVGALLVGVMYAKTLAFSRKLPFIGVNHLEGHLFAPMLEAPLEPPFIGLLISGGHTMLLDVPRWGSYNWLGGTLDDAAGEAFDKVAKILGLGYPGGAAIESLAREGRAGAITLPRPLLAAEPDDPNHFNFSFSGLKTAALRAIETSDRASFRPADLALAFQDAAVEVLVTKTALAAEAMHRQRVVLGGGVACNQALVTAMRDRLAGVAELHVASPRLNTDNAAMIAAAGGWRLRRGDRSRLDLEARDHLPLPGFQAPEAVTA
jgi:N6-L-threonylcarbamoyladenine synthase